MFTEKQLSEMFRTGTLDGISVNRSPEPTTNHYRSQIKRVRVTIDDKQYIIKRLYNLDENTGFEIVVHYEIEKSAG